MSSVETNIEEMERLAATLENKATAKEAIIGELETKLDQAKAKKAKKAQKGRKGAAVAGKEDELETLKARAIAARKDPTCSSDRAVWDYIFKLAEQQHLKQVRRQCAWNTCNLLSFKEYVEEFHSPRH